MKRLVVVLLALSAAACIAQAPEQTDSVRQSSYFDTSGRNDVLGGGARMIPITTPKGLFKVWTKRVGNNPKIKLLLLHGQYDGLDPMQYGKPAGLPCGSFGFSLHATLPPIPRLSPPACPADRSASR